MYKELLTGLLDIDQPATPELEALRAIILRKFWCHWLENLSDEESEKLSNFRAPNCDIMVDLEWIEQIHALRLLRHWGRRFDGDTLPPGFSTYVTRRTIYTDGPIRVDANSDVPEELLRDIYLSADLEA
jgi:hypothetical protein